MKAVARQAPSHWECHCNVAGWTQTYIRSTRTTPVPDAVKPRFFLRSSHCRARIFKAICPTRELAHADTFTYWLGPSPWCGVTGLTPLPPLGVRKARVGWGGGAGQQRDRRAWVRSFIQGQAWTTMNFICSAAAVSRQQLICCDCARLEELIFEIGRNDLTCSILWKCNCDFEFSVSCIARVQIWWMFL